MVKIDPELVTDVAVSVGKLGVFLAVDDKLVK